MKKIILLLLLVATALSCSKDDAEPQQIDMSGLQGIWELRKMTESGAVVDLQACELNERYSFTNGTYTHLYDTFHNCNFESKTGHYEVFKNDIALSNEPGGNIEMLWRVIELSDSKLILGTQMTIGDNYAIRFEYERIP